MRFSALAAVPVARLAAATLLTAGLSGVPLFAAPLAASSGAPLAAATEPKPVLPFIENDYPAALARARAKKLPIFADAWAPW